MGGGGGWGGGGGGEGRGGGEYSEKAPDYEPQEMPPTEAREFEPQRDSNPLPGIGGRHLLGKQTW